MNRRRCLVSLVAVVLATAGLHAGAADAGRVYGAIAFPSGDFRVYLSDLDGGWPRPVTSLDAGRASWSPSWSPNGARLALAATRCAVPPVHRIVGDCGVHEGIVATVDADGRKEKVLFSLSGSYVGSVAWSPDGHTIAFDVGASGTGSGTALMLVNADGSQLRQLAVGVSPAWSPDSKQVAYIDSGDGGVNVIPASGPGLPRRVSPVAVNAGLTDGFRIAPTWSPDGKTIGFAATRSVSANISDVSARHVWLVDADGPGVRALNDRGSVVYPPSWSRDGKRIVYQDSAGIWVSGRDGSHLRRIVTRYGLAPTVGARSPATPSWSPSGRYIAYQQTDYVGAFDWHYSLRLVRPDGSSPRVVADLDDGGGFASHVSANWPLLWRPGSRT